MKMIYISEYDGFVWFEVLTAMTAYSSIFVLYVRRKSTYVLEKYFAFIFKVEG
jgi:hypothetical protein